MGGATFKKVTSVKHKPAGGIAMVGGLKCHLSIKTLKTNINLCVFPIHILQMASTHFWSYIENSLPQQKKFANFNEFSEIKKVRKIRTKIR